MLAAVVGSTEIIDQPLVGNLDKAVDQIVWNPLLNIYSKAAQKLLLDKLALKKRKQLYDALKPNLFRILISKQSYNSEFKTDVTIGYFNVLCTQKKVELLTNITHINLKATTTVEALFESKEASKRDLLQARIESNTSKSLLQLAQNEHAAAWQVLAAVVGSTEIIDQPLVGNLDKAVDQIVWESSLEHLLESSPEIAARQASVKKAKTIVRRAQAESVPDINIQAILQHDSSIGAANGNLMVSVPVPIKNKTRARVREAEHALIAAQKLVASLRLQLQQRLAPVFKLTPAVNNKSQPTAKVF